MATPIEALHNVGARTLAVFKRAGLTTVGDVFGLWPNAYAQSAYVYGSLQNAIDQLKEESDADGIYDDAYWLALGTRVRTIVDRVRSDEARPYEPDHFVCPITLQLMVDPVLSKYGDTYERNAIERLVRQTGKDMYRRPLSESELFENRSLRDAIAYYKLHELRFAVPIKLHHQQP
jgi:hypothetical protein